MQTRLQLIIIFITVSSNLYSQKVEVPNLEEEEKLYFSYLKSNLDELVIESPVIEEDYVMPWNTILLEQIKNLSLKYLDNLILQYAPPEEDSVEPNNSLRLVTTIDTALSISAGRKLRDYYKIEIDYSKENTIARNAKLKIPIKRDIFKRFEGKELTKVVSYINVDTIKEKTSGTKSKVYPTIDPEGKLNIDFYYVTGYDTLAIDKSMQNKILELNDLSFELSFINKGDLFLKFRDSVPGHSIINQLRYLALNSKNQVIHDITRYENTHQTVKFHDHTNEVGPWEFDRTLTGKSILLNEKFANISKEKIRDFLGTLNPEDNTKYKDVLVLQTNLDFEKIYLLFPRYKTIKKELQISEPE